MADLKFCVFCGNPPKSKNKEHVLPQWLLRMTGDPRRVVPIGLNYRSGKDISFDWSSFTMPACEACNAEFSVLEGQVLPVIQALQDRKSLCSKDYFILLDWLDKVRVGLWLNYHVLQGNPTDIEPSFHIKSRLRKKDRFLAVYPINHEKKGLNPVGVETLAFHRSPSVFGLRINDVFIISGSTDYMFSARCGFPYPSKMELLLDGDNAGCMQLGEFSSTKKVKYPLLRFKLYKASVLLFQPIMQLSKDALQEMPPVFLGGNPKDDEFLISNTMGENFPGVGKVFRQSGEKIFRIDDEQEVVCFDSIKGSECKTLGELMSQVYELQIFLKGQCVPLAKSLGVRAQWNQAETLMRKQNKIIMKSCLKKIILS